MHRAHIHKKAGDLFLSQQLCKDHSYLTDARDFVDVEFDK